MNTAILNVYTDGACRRNGTANARASIGIWVEDHPELDVSECLDSDMPQTNQMAELVAIQRALSLSNTYDRINILSDSMYAINCVTEWYKGWMKNGWKTSKNKVPVNIAIVRQIVTELDSLYVKDKVINFIYVPGHRGVLGNVKADELANMALQVDNF